MKPMRDTPNKSPVVRADRLVAIRYPSGLRFERLSANGLVQRVRSLVQFANMALLLAVALLAAGCKTDLYTKQSEVDANGMVSVLLEAGVDAKKISADGGKTWNIQTEEEDVVRALAVLRANGLPQDKHVSLGDMFKKDGLVSTPTEERVRFIYGVSQELTDTLAQIDGVITARVHIVLPNNDPLANDVKPSSASVFVKYRPQANLSALTPAIKNMVARSVEGLAYENVSVTLVPGAPFTAPPSASSHVGLIVGLSLVLILAAAIAGILWVQPSWLPAALRRKARVPTAESEA